MTAIELVVASVVLLVALLALASSMNASRTLRTVTTENGLATDAAGNMLERLRNTTFDEVFARYNDDPADDPNGPGTAPGHRFAVQGLRALDSAADGLVGEVVFPTILAPSGALGPAGGPAPMVSQLREDVVDPALGMPRDLNADLVIDAADHAGDYFVLPVSIELRWRGGNGERVHRVYTMLCELPRQ